MGLSSRSARRNDRSRSCVSGAGPVADPVVSALQQVLRDDQIRFDDVARAVARRDASLIDDGVSGPICYAESRDDVVAISRVATRLRRPLVPRGAGTGLAGGAVPLDAAIVVSLARMNRVLDIDIVNRVAWVEPGVVNLDLNRQLGRLGFNFAPDPSSQQVCTIGGNVANNSGGPHCLAYGVTNAHVAAIEVVLPGGEVAMLGGLDAEPSGLDLRGAFIGGEGMLGIATKVAVVLSPSPPAVRTLLFGFSSIEDAANTVSAVIASGVVPAAMEVMERDIVRAIERYVGAGYPTEASAVLLVEIEGLEDGVAIETAAVVSIGRSHGATTVHVATDPTQRELLWKGRKSAFGAVAQIAPDYYLHDTVVPRTRLAEVLLQVHDIARRHDVRVMNVFHAGDGNLHPLLVFDAREPGVIDRVHAAGAEIVAVSLAAGGVLSGEHGIGLEKQQFMLDMFSADDLDHQDRLRRSFDPDCLANTGKVLPSGHSCGDVQQLREVPEGLWL